MRPLHLVVMLRLQGQHVSSSDYFVLIQRVHLIVAAADGLSGLWSSAACADSGAWKEGAFPAWAQRSGSVAHAQQKS